MQSVSRILLGALAVAILSVLTACGSGSNTVAPGDVRLVNSTTATVNLELNGATEVTSLAGHSTGGFFEVTPGTYSVSVASVNGALTSAQAYAFPFGTSQYWTVVAYTRNNQTIETAAIEENLSAPAAGFLTFDADNAWSGVGPLDIYLLPTSTPALTPTGNTPVFQTVLGQTVPVTIGQGTYDIWVTAAGNPSDVRLTWTSVNLSSTNTIFAANNYVATLVLTPTASSALVNATLVAQDSTAAFNTNGSARVRLISGLPASAAPAGATVSSLSTTISASWHSPSPYYLVNGGSTLSALGLTGGASITLSGTTTFASGNDYSILVYGSPSAPSYTVLSDNSLVSPGNASVRLINAAADSTNPPGVTLTINGAQVAAAVPYGSASSYASVTPASSPNILVSGVLGGSGVTLSPLGATPLSSGLIYTVFVDDLNSATDQPYVIQDNR